MSRRETTGQFASKPTEETCGDLRPKFKLRPPAPQAVEHKPTSCIQASQSKSNQSEAQGAFAIFLAFFLRFVDLFDLPFAVSCQSAQLLWSLVQVMFHARRPQYGGLSPTVRRL